MQKSVQTSKKLAVRAADTVPKRMLEMEKAINDRDYETFGALTMLVMKRDISFHIPTGF
jgi:diphosphomevalonate decarboxylase